MTRADQNSKGRNGRCWPAGPVEFIGLGFFPGGWWGAGNGLMKIFRMEYHMTLKPMGETECEMDDVTLILTSNSVRNSCHIYIPYFSLLLAFCSLRRHFDRQLFLCLAYTLPRFLPSAPGQAQRITPNPPNCCSCATSVVERDASLSFYIQGHWMGRLPALLCVSFAGSAGVYRSMSPIAWA